MATVAAQANIAPVAGGSKLQTNREIIDDLLLSACQKVVDLTKGYSPTLVHAKVQSREGDSYILSRLAKAAEGSFALTESAEKSDTRIELSEVKIEVKYSADSTDSDSLIRSVVVSLSGLVSGRDKVLHYFATPVALAQGKISRSDVPEIQNGDYRFLRGDVPEKPVTFFESVAAPAIAVSATLVSLILLFTVRSR